MYHNSKYIICQFAVNQDILTSCKKQNLNKETLEKLENSNKKRQLFISFLLDHL